MKNYVFHFQIQSLFYTKESLEEAIASVSTGSLEKVWKNKSYTVNHIIKVNRK